MYTGRLTFVVLKLKPLFDSFRLFSSKYEAIDKKKVSSPAEDLFNQKVYRALQKRKIRHSEVHFRKQNCPKKFARKTVH